MDVDILLTEITPLIHRFEEEGGKHIAQWPSANLDVGSPTAAAGRTTDAAIPARKGEDVMSGTSLPRTVQDYVRDLTAQVEGFQPSAHARRDSAPVSADGRINHDRARRRARDRLLLAVTVNGMLEWFEWVEQAIDQAIARDLAPDEEEA